jgi:hypothetical protein
MAERGPDLRGLELALAEMGGDVAFPPTPTLAGTVMARLETERAARARPPFARTAIWSRRRALVVAAVGILALLALAFGARLVFGGAEVRVRPGVTPSGPALGPGALGEPVSLDALRDALPFPVALPPGDPPDVVHVIRTVSGPGALLAWEPEDRYEPVAGTPWGLVILQVADDEETIAKDVNRFQDLTEVEVGGLPAAWIDAPHELLLFTARGTESFAVRGNVLIWTRDGVTFRMETSLRLRRAVALAESIR